MTRFFMDRDDDVKKLDPDLLPPGCGHGNKYRYKVGLNDYGVPYELVQWCKKHCQFEWGWHFKKLGDTPYNLDIFADQYDKQMAFLSFKSKRDAVYFMLTHGPNNN